MTLILFSGMSGTAKVNLFSLFTFTLTSCLNKIDGTPLLSSQGYQKITYELIWCHTSITSSSIPWWCRLSSFWMVLVTTWILRRQPLWWNLLSIPLWLSQGHPKKKFGQDIACCWCHRQANTLIPLVHHLQDAKHSLWQTQAMCVWSCTAWSRWSKKFSSHHTTLWTKNLWSIFLTQVTTCLLITKIKTRE